MKNDLIDSTADSKLSMKRLRSLLIVAVMLIAPAAAGVAQSQRGSAQTLSEGRIEFFEYVGPYPTPLSMNCQPKPGEKFLILRDVLSPLSHVSSFELPSGEICFHQASPGSLADQLFAKHFRRALTSSDPEMQARKAAAERREQATARIKMINQQNRERVAAEAQAAKAADAARAAKVRQEGETRSALFPVVRQWFAAANAGLYSQLPSFMAPDVAQGTSMRALADQLTENGTVNRVEFVSEQVRGEGGQLRYRIVFNSGQFVERDARMVLLRGRWLLDRPAFGF